MQAYSRCIALSLRYTLSYNLGKKAFEPPFSSLQCSKPVEALSRKKKHGTDEVQSKNIPIISYAIA